MAGDWIPIRKDLDRCREVSIIVEQTQLSVDEIVGQLVRFWSWVDGETSDGWLPGATEKTLEIASGICPQVVRILSEVKWIEIRDDGIQIGNFERWFGQNAKRRLADAKRKRLSRQQMHRTAKRPRLVRKASKQKRTTEEERKEEKEEKKVVERKEKSLIHSTITTATTASLDLDEEYLAELQANPAFAHLNVRAVYDKLLIRCHAEGKSPTRIRFINWLNRERPSSGNGASVCSSDQLTDSGELTIEARLDRMHKPRLPGVWVWATGYGWMDDSKME